MLAGGKPDDRQAGLRITLSVSFTATRAIGSPRRTGYGTRKVAGRGVGGCLLRVQHPRDNRQEAGIVSWEFPA